MIKEIVIRLIWILGRMFSFLYSHKINERINSIKIIFYSAWISREFKLFGKGSRIYSCNRLSGGKYITVGTNCSFGERTVLTAWDKHGSDTFNPNIIVGNDVAIGDDSHITATNRIEIGNNVLTGKKITITDSAHGKSNFDSLLIHPSARPLYSEGPVIIEDGVWIGDKVSILPNVRIGKNAIIGANSVVTKNIPTNCVAAGIPAKVIKVIEK